VKQKNKKAVGVCLLTGVANRSLGCTIIELVSGKPPYYDLPPMSAMFRVLALFICFVCNVV
jgi:hypothetical protein